MSYKDIEEKLLTPDRSIRAVSRYGDVRKILKDFSKKKVTHLFLDELTEELTKLIDGYMNRALEESYQAGVMDAIEEFKQAGITDIELDKWDFGDFELTEEDKEAFARMEAEMKSSPLELEELDLTGEIFEINDFFKINKD